MIKHAYENIPLTLEYVLAKLEKGDDVVVNQDIPGQDGSVSIPEGAKIKVIRTEFDNQEFPGLFRLDVFGGWGFHFGNNGLGWMFSHEVLSEEESLGAEYGEIPYMVFKLLLELKILTRKDLINRIIEGSMMVPLRERRKVFNSIDDAILNMLKLDLLSVSERRSSEGEQMIYLTDKGKAILGGQP